MSKNGFLILFLMKVWTIPHFAQYRNTFGCLESLLEVARGVGKLSHFSLGLVLHSWWFFPLLGLERKMSYELEVLMRRGGAIGAWSSC